MQCQAVKRAAVCRETPVPEYHPTWRHRLSHRYGVLCYIFRRAPLFYLNAIELVPVLCCSFESANKIGSTVADIQCGSVLYRYLPKTDCLYPIGIHLNDQLI